MKTTTPPKKAGLKTLEELRVDCSKAITCLYIAVEEDIANDVEKKVGDYIKALEKQVPAPGTTFSVEEFCEWIDDCSRLKTITANKLIEHIKRPEDGIAAVTNRKE